MTPVEATETIRRSFPNVGAYVLARHMTDDYYPFEIPGWVDLHPTIQELVFDAWDYAAFDDPDLDTPPKFYTVLSRIRRYDERLKTAA